jgi:hypothetical protein
VSLSDYTPFQTPNPLTGELITIYNLNRDKQGLVETVDRTSELNERTYNGFELSFAGRFRNGAMVQGGWSVERTVSVTCDTDDPNLFRFCDQTGATNQELGRVESIPYRHEYKLAATYPFPWGIHASMSLLSYPGGELGVAWPVPASLFPGGRTRTVSVPLIPPGTEFLERWSQLDLAFKKSIRVRAVDLRPQVEVFNVLNSSTVLAEVQTFGPSLGAPSRTLQARLVRLGMIVTF